MDGMDGWSGFGGKLSILVSQAIKCVIISLHFVIHDTVPFILGTFELRTG